MQNRGVRPGRPVQRPIYSRKPASVEKPKDWRLLIWLIVIVLISLGIVYRLFIVQVVSHDELFSKAQNQHQYYEELTPRRGELYLQNKGKTYPAAVNEEMDSVIAVPKNISDIEGTSMTLATILNMPVEEVRQKLTKNRDDLYEVIKRKLTDDESLALQNKNLRGIELVPEYWRTYPASPLASQTIGFLGYNGDDKSGQYGIEEYFDSSLRGKGGFLKAEKDTGGRWISIGSRTLQKAEDGDKLVLTIEQSVQYFLEKKLEEIVKKFDATGGNILIMEPKTGRIIAMANYPSYDNSDYTNISDASLFQNRSIQEQFEPGSIFKTLTYAIALDTGKITPDTTYNDSGSVTMSGFTMHNFDGLGRGVIPMTKALDLSLNTGAIFAQQRAGKETFYQYIKNFGFGEPTGIDLVGEAKGDIKNLAQMKDLNFATASFGQGVAVTSVQMASAFSALINGGYLMKPQIIQKVVKRDGEEIEVPPKEVRRIITQRTSDTIKAMLISVVKNGWSVKASVPGYLIGSKTGTAQMPNPNGGGYLEDFIHTFICGAPMNDPKFVVLTKLNRVRAAKYSSDTVSPVTRQVLEFLFDYYNMSPTEDITDKERQEYKRYSEQLRKFLGSNDNPQEINSSSNIEKQINSGASNENNNQNDNKKNQKNNKKPSSSEIHASIGSGAGN